MARILKANGRGVHGSHLPLPMTIFSFTEHVFSFCWLIPISLKTSYTIIFISCELYFLKSKKQKPSWLHLSLQSHFPTSLFSKTLPNLSVLYFHFLFPFSLHSTQITLLFPRLHWEYSSSSHKGGCYFLRSFWILILLDLSTAFYSWSLPFLKKSRMEI